MSGPAPEPSGVGPEPLALEVSLAHYVATLPEGERVPLAELAERFSRPVSEVESALWAVVNVEDVDLTTIAGATVEDGDLVKYLRGGYGEDFRRPVRLSPVQARAALLALDLAAGAVEPGLLRDLREKVRAAAGREVGKVEVGKELSEDAGIIGAIESCRREERLLEIRYPSTGESDEPLYRTVEPYLMSNLGGVWYLNAYCRSAEGERLFRLDRILSARALPEEFAPRAGLAFKTQLGDIDPRSFASRRAVVRFSANIARWMAERAELDLLEKHPDGSADYALYYTDPGWAAGRVMTYLGEAVVLKPESLREEVRRRAERMLQAQREEI